MIHLIITTILAAFILMVSAGLNVSTDIQMIVLAIILAGGLAGMKYDD